MMISDGRVRAMCWDVTRLLSTRCLTILRRRNYEFLNLSIFLMKKGDQALYRDWLREAQFSDDYHKVGSFHRSAKMLSVLMNHRFIPSSHLTSLV